MKRILISILSFIIFILEFFIQFCYILFNLFKTSYIIFLLLLIRYHNRIQCMTNQSNYIQIKEVNI